MALMRRPERVCISGPPTAQFAPRGDVVAEVAKLKQQTGGNILLLGHGRLGETLLRERLIDAIDLSIHPLMVGRGQPLFRQGQAVQLKLTATKVFSKIVKLTYEPQY
jgi:dihydrofolate reductase